MSLGSDLAFTIQVLEALGHLVSIVVLLLLLILFLLKQLLDVE